ncbi:hypothetical protein COV53_06575 [Candidatus Gottesmanbacteria bacterium CG11_big_fil_rev_8_21_14_0_20_37_11]|uniref:DUF5667 domain-containing protein n=3 Tax=Candidatus Gottesmaniibacteriota TaxID=1752720 RepID=A0A2M7RQW6_9BACT|nr:MAG: hypothetical protein AUJ73_01020 [Candidatus Gottesmanbacteria bacterium CG1_02_37_22]PIP32960.1 MAG: hypothetical protein COX23_01705 [Candidatus Gottesmanbacteria bacterium CG23_combo_of_CG06-09_8_20_14_all_37_19]PIR07757.1 MAG: hypothetical protein COV53_06575 [Candidatus Gottesmanbacteria bacterium CG11_big_fil_rev_8_21_14_0_20_37_11]PIZ02354.1 MAG: hypothetical protein COY59_05045 [Candidatus Gottesmanbacteria bacterium CG_4_10_14_0_8_um_filter_37_24]
MKHVLTFILLILFSLILFQEAVNAQEAQKPDNMSSIPVPTIVYVLPYPGILPNHPLFFLKELRDKILIIITRKTNEKSNLYLLLSDKSLVMGQMLWESKNYDESVKSLEKGESHLLNSILVLLKNQNGETLPPGFTDKIKLAAKKHEEVIKNILTTTSESGMLNKLNNVLSINHQASQQITTIK